MDPLKHSPTPIISYMRRHGLSQIAFAKRIGVSQSAVSQWLSGEVNLDLRRAQKIERKTKGEITRRDLFPHLFAEAA